MKLCILLICLLTGVNAHATDIVFDCSAEIQIDVGKTQKIGMTVEAQGGELVTYLVGATQPGPLATSKQVLSFTDGILVGGVREIISAVTLSPSEQLQISSVAIYTQGNFDEDAAGVRGVEFLDSKSNILAKGMFFGWGGPVACQ